MSCIGLLIATVVSVFAVQASRSTETVYGIQLADAARFPVLLNIDVEVLDRDCSGRDWVVILSEELTFHFNPTKSQMPEAIDVSSSFPLFFR